MPLTTCSERRLAGVVTAFLLFFAPWCGAAEPRINQAGQIEIAAVDLRVFRGDANTPLFGHLARDGTVVRFAPSLPLVPGESYRVEFQTTNGRWHSERLRFDAAPAGMPEVSLSPTTGTLPANTLKVYLHFTQPMEQGVFLDRITLHRQDGSIVAGAFRETELWSPDGARLTLWFHPGRQKTGVNLNRDEGPVLREGEAHRLQITPEWRSAAGVPLGKTFSFALSAGPADHTCPEPESWKITAPKAGTRDILRVTFDEPLDPAMLISALTVKHGHERLAGAVAVAADARSWSFSPAKDWMAGRQAIEIDPLLEDLAGNNLQHPFEVDREQPAQPAKVNVLPFEVR